MTSRTWTFEAPGPLLGCGIDSEKIARFEKVAADETPWPLIFTPAEVAHARSSADPARRFCASFAAKEAVFKALGAPYNFTDCELLPDFDREEQDLRLAEALRRERGVTAAKAFLRREPEDCGELIVVAYLFR
jgi:phosphopantetheine--protein transferase-like protein